MQEYEISFATDEDYKSGIMSCVGEISGDCKSIGKPGTNAALYDIFSSASRRIFVRRNGKIVGQSLVYIDKKEETLVIFSLACIPSINSEKIRPLIEKLSVELLKANPKVKRIAIGVGGRNFATMNAQNWPSCWPSNPQDATEP